MAQAPSLSSFSSLLLLLLQERGPGSRLLLWVGHFDNTDSHMTNNFNLSGWILGMRVDMKTNDLVVETQSSFPIATSSHSNYHNSVIITSVLALE